MMREKDLAGRSSTGSSASGTPAGWPPDLPLGTHQLISRRGYLHRGMYFGGGRVDHYSGLSRAWRRGPVQEVTLEQFAGGRYMA